MAHKSNGSGYSSKINQVGSGTPTKKNLFKGTTKGPKGLSGPEYDAKFRKPFPNMGKTPTGRKN